jgi:predicted DCC family thiol-disulfide oxidoreductase YuxK
VSSSKPLLIYDGKCGFCKIWIDYWRKLTGERVEYAPSQEVGEQYPQIPKEHFSLGVQLVRTDGSVVDNARAVFETLRLERFYNPFAPVWEWGYGIVASHRDFFYHMTKWTFGTQIEPMRFAITEWIFVRMLAVIYAIAFGSLIGQIRGLLGAHGILPVVDYLKAVAESAGAMRFFYVPTVFWIDASDAVLVGVCWVGLGVAVLVLAGIFERAGLAILFVLYLSLSTAGQEFLSFQWDALLVEAGFLAIFLVHSRVVVWLFRWLLFRLMFLSGAVKLLSHDRTWRNLSALSFHYWTQPLPNRISWYMAQLPEWFQKVSTAVVLGVELGIPFLIFAPRRIRKFGAWCLLGLQVLIFLTGNYTFFNLLAMAMCVFLFDDRDFERWLRPVAGGTACPTKTSKTTARATRIIVAVVAILVLAIGLARMVETFLNVPVFIVKYTAPFEIVNSYGLFAMMTTERPEIIVEGSMDGETWTPYSFRYKPGDLARAPRWAAPYQPRLDWQMWFAALGNYRENPWFVNFAVKLLEGSPEVRGLLEADPFQGRSPRYVRAMLYDYTFTDAGERRETGNWWKREARGQYLPPVGLKATSGLHLVR